jgi:hypothetical protein
MAMAESRSSLPILTEDKFCLCASLNHFFHYKYDCPAALKVQSYSVGGVAWFAASLCDLIRVVSFDRGPRERARSPTKLPTYRYENPCPIATKLIDLVFTCAKRTISL